MTSRLFRSAKARWLLTLLLVLALSIGMVAQVLAVGPIGTAAGFEDDDGNLVTDAVFDWNEFTPVTWLGNAPYRIGSASESGWVFTGIEDAQVATSDTAFAGGVKQDDNCATVNTGKAPNKDDLERIYISTKTVDVPNDTVDHLFLMLGWVRIPQNTTSSSAHVGFEFNQGVTPCAGNAGGLVQREAGDLLFVYDFEGGSASPVITVRKWVTSGACEVGSSSAPCWGPATNLTQFGFAEAKVNTGFSVSDALAPNGADTLNDSEFGEAGIDLTAAEIVDPENCFTFGSVFGVSRSSGNSGQAQMKDLVGPAEIEITNCGQVKIIKHTNPRGLDQNFSFTSTLAGPQLNCSQPSPETGAAFTLNDSGNTTADSDANTQHCHNVPTGSYTVTEGADPSGFSFSDLTCTVDGTGTSASTNGKVASFTLGPAGTVVCTYTNDLQQGALKILKQSTKTGNPLVANAGAVFSYSGPSGNGSVTDNGSGDESNTVGELCVSGLLPGSYTVNETSAPNGYGDASQSNVSFTVVDGTDCGSNEPSDAVSATFTNPPLSDIQVNFRDGGSGETSATISCDNVTGTSDLTAVTGWDTSETVTGIEAPTTVICTIVIDP